MLTEHDLAPAPRLSVQAELALLKLQVREALQAAEMAEAAAARAEAELAARRAARQAPAPAESAPEEVVGEAADAQPSVELEPTLVSAASALLGDRPLPALATMVGQHRTPSESPRRTDVAAAPPDLSGIAGPEPMPEPDSAALWAEHAAQPVVAGARVDDGVATEAPSAVLPSIAVSFDAFAQAEPRPARWLSVRVHDVDDDAAMPSPGPIEDTASRGDVHADADRVGTVEHARDWALPRSSSVTAEPTTQPRDESGAAGPVDVWSASSTAAELDGSVEPAATPAVTSAAPVNFTPEAFAQALASVLDQRMGTLGTSIAATKAPKRSVWSYARHPDVVLLSVATIGLVVVLVAWMG
jgi:hypothetical protein